MAFRGRGRGRGLPETDEEPLTSPVSQQGPLVSSQGSRGAKLDITTNYLPIKLAEGRPGLVEYHVSYSPPLESVVWRRKALKQFEYRLGTVKSFDGVVLYLPYFLDHDVTVLHGIHPVDPDLELIVHITFVKVKCLRDSIIFLNILLRRIMLELGFVEIGRTFCDLERIRSLDQHKLEVWSGWKVTVEDQEGGLMICANSQGRVLRADTVYDYYRSIRGDPRVQEKFNNFVLNKVILVKYNHAQYKIDDVDWDMTPASLFLRKSEEISFADYLKVHHNVQVRDMGQPMLISKLKARKNAGMKGESEQKVVALVPEFCYLTGLTEEQRGNFRVMNALDDAIRQTPVQRVDELNAFIKRLSSSEPVQELLLQWNLVIEPTLINVEGRRRDGPKLQFKDDGPERTINTDFRGEVESSVYCPVPLKRFAVICIQRDIELAQRFFDLYKHLSTRLGIRMEQTGELITIRQSRPHDFVKALQDCRNKRVHFVVVIMPTERDDVYGAIKTHCLTDDPIPSQCILSKTLERKLQLLPSIVRNIALQINCKLGGSLWALKMPVREKIMFVGIDAAHDPYKKDLSIIALVASMNNECTKYYSVTANCKVHQEMADNLRIMMEDALKNYWKSNTFFPNRIIVFRDGASVGAMDQMAKTELEQLILAQNTYAPKAKLTFVLVAKKISQRFFVSTDKKRTRFDNPLPGTIIDHCVTRRNTYDFYLVSQQIRRGTVNPTHFIVLNPEDSMRPDLLQKLAYITTFMYFNWAGPIRVPAMVQYAHKLADLRSRYVKGQPHATLCNTLYYL